MIDNMIPDHLKKQLAEIRAGGLWKSRTGYYHPARRALSACGRARRS